MNAAPIHHIVQQLVAARDDGRKAIGIELEEKYCETAAKRLKVLRVGREQDASERAVLGHGNNLFSCAGQFNAQVIFQTE